MNHLLPLSMFVLLQGCAQVRGGSQIGTEAGYGCPIAEREPFPTGTPEGFPWSVEEAVAATLGPTVGTNDDEAVVSLDTTLDGEVQFVTTFVSPEMGEATCPDFIEIPVVLVLQGPGVDETVETTVNAYANGRVFTGFAIAAGQTATTQPEGGADTLDLSAWLEQGWEGELAWLIESQDGTGDEATVTLERRTIWNFLTLH